MSDGRRRRNRKPKEERDRIAATQQRTILVKREENNASGSSSSMARHHHEQHNELQPKILLKTKSDKTSSEVEALTSNLSAELPLKTIIVTRSDVAASPAHSPHLSKDAGAAQPTVPANKEIVEPVPHMTRPATVISSTGFINAGARKTFMANNTDFLVVGVIGTQGVGKSTICNLLANEQANFDYFHKIFVEEDGIFPTKLKPHKFTARSRTESTHMFITKDRMILLDSPPVLCNSYKKDMVTNEMDDLRQIISFLSVCHLLIVVHDDFFVNMSFMRLLHFAELMKPFESEFLPNLLFVKNRAKRQDFMLGKHAEMDVMLKSFFKDSHLRIYRGQTMSANHHNSGESKSKKSTSRSTHDSERIINSFLLPEVKEHCPTAAYHAPLSELIEQLRSLVFMTPRGQMHEGPNELTESTWFDLLSKVAQGSKHFFFDNYEKIQRKHLEMLNLNGNAGSGSGPGGVAAAATGANKNSHDNWRE